MPSPDLTVATRLRAIVQPEQGRAFLLNLLNDDQLFQVACWLKEGKPNELIARMMVDLWAECRFRTERRKMIWAEFIEPLQELRNTIFEGPDPIAESVEFEFDPIEENASFVRQLKTEWLQWNRKARRPKAPAAVLERTDRIARLIMESLKNHVIMLEKAGEIKPGSDDQRPATKYQIDNVQMVVNQLAGDDMPGFVDSVVSGLEKVAQPIKQIANGKTRK